jgi:hypothetical protein
LYNLQPGETQGCFSQNRKSWIRTGQRLRTLKELPGEIEVEERYVVGNKTTWSRAREV